MTPPAAHAAVALPLRDIKPLQPYGGGSALWLGAAAAAALAAAFAIAALVRLRRRVRRARPATALERLDALAGEPVLGDQPFYFALTAILRGHLEHRFGLCCLERSTEEFLPSLGRLPVDEEVRSRLVRLFLDAEPRKYARAHAGLELRRDDLRFARDFLRATAPGADGSG